MLLSLLSKRSLHDDSRDAYGFAVRPQHIHRYREYAAIYKEEEEERSKKWSGFLDLTEKCLEDVLGEAATISNVTGGVDKGCEELHTWCESRRSLSVVDCMMGVRVKKKYALKDDKNNSSIEADKMPTDAFAHLRKELEFLVQGGVPKDLRGEVWQAFVGVKTRRVERYYQDLLDTEIGIEDNGKQNEQKRRELPVKLKKQIEKDLPRTFPGHPALNERGRNSLRRVLLAYARHNPSVGYCQAMNFFAGLLLLMMPEENAFWTLVGIIDDYFEGYFSEQMIESQVDQLVFEDLVRERFPKLVSHFEHLGVEVAWISSPWFLTIFVNMLPWESVLRVWDVLLFEGNRVMLFRTALTLMDLYGPPVVATKDAGDAVTLLQTLAGSTFDSSQLVLTASMGFLTVNEDTLQEIRKKHRPAILAASNEKAEGLVDKNPKRLASKLYSFKHAPELTVKESKSKAVPGRVEMPNQDSHSKELDNILNGIGFDSEVDALPDLQEQVIWLKAELCRLLEEKRSAMLRAEELEAALLEMVKEDNRRELYIRIEKLGKEVADLRQALAGKKVEDENNMPQVMLREEQEENSTEEDQVITRHDALVLRRAMKILQGKYDKAMCTVAEMEKRAVMAESMLAATLEYHSGQSRASASPSPGRSESPGKRTSILPFGLGWRDRYKVSFSAASPAGSNSCTLHAIFHVLRDSPRASQHQVNYT